MSRTANIEGYAALFNRPDLGGDIIRSGAFAHAQARDIRLLWQHDTRTPIGRWLHLHEDRTGLFVHGELLLDSPHGREAHTLLTGRALNGLSIGFNTRVARRHKGGRTILKLDLWEISIVTFPMMPGARITRIGSAQGPAEKFRTLTRQHAA
ncbi:HK97 family phage prohead protease [Parvularcula sp. IMCC14364]|uniref:HK97 family phage prohead protease n=1 Tax=Parvularcula sp. IMCC14364 TaxID=3067902 RepID=UPI0027421D02|nr:HK97 family phage prohead protease [Parvularcula sp. IMCC14364]